MLFTDKDCETEAQRENMRILSKTTIYIDWKVSF